jgi:hypothetical protein
MLAAMKGLLANLESMTYDEVVQSAKTTPPEMAALGLQMPTASELWAIRINSITNLQKKIAKLEAE